jgi:hypothetical protein
VDQNQPRRLLPEISWWIDAVAGCRCRESHLAGLRVFDVNGEELGRNLYGENTARLAMPGAGPIIEGATHGIECIRLDELKLFETRVCT